jgi:hypothetical protein
MPVLVAAAPQRLALNSAALSTYSSAGLPLIGQSTTRCSSQAP